MIDAGMNVARLDFSQGDHKSNGQLVANLQAGLKQRPDKVVALILETKGPEIRTGVLKEGKPVDLVAGQSLEIFTDYAIEGDDTKITCNYKNLPATLSIGSTVVVGDGCLTAEVTEVCEVSYTFGYSDLATSFAYFTCCSETHVKFDYFHSNTQNVYYTTIGLRYQSN